MVTRRERAGLSMSIPPGRLQRSLEEHVISCADGVRLETGAAEPLRVEIVLLRRGRVPHYRVDIQLEDGTATVSQSSVDPFLAARLAFRAVEHQLVARMHVSPYAFS